MCYVPQESQWRREEREGRRERGKEGKGIRRKARREGFASKWLNVNRDGAGEGLDVSQNLK